MVCLARAVKDAQADEKHCYHCSSPEHFICNCLLVKTSREKRQVKWEEGDGVDKGSPDPSGNDKCHRAPHRGSWGVKTSLQTPFLNLDPSQQWYGVEKVARVRLNGESCMSLLDNGTQINTITLKYISDHLLQVGPITNLIGAKSCLHGVGQCLHQTIGLHRNPGSGRQSSGPWRRSDSPSNPGPFYFCGPDPSDFRKIHHQLSC